MKKVNIKILVLTGDGINCENETALAFSELGVKARIIHVVDLIENSEILDETHILVLPGGFSFGDEIGSGKILALKLKYALGEKLKKFIDSKKLIIGICNGFQVLTRLGFLPKPFSPREMTLTHNRQGHFINRWVDLNVPASKCVWMKEVKTSKISLPIRHGEGCIVFAGDEKKQRETYDFLLGNGQIALTYSNDVNGSYERIAAVCDPTGLILGLMPHPEAATSLWHSPDGKSKEHGRGVGLFIFESGIKYCEENFK